MAGLVAFWLAAGANGAGQSSWGPTAFAVCGDEDAAINLALRTVERFAGWDVVVTPAFAGEPPESTVL